MMVATAERVLLCMPTCICCFTTSKGLRTAQTAMSAARDNKRYWEGSHHRVRALAQQQRSCYRLGVLTCDSSSYVCASQVLAPGQFLILLLAALVRSPAASTRFFVSLALQIWGLSHNVVSAQYQNVAAAGKEPAMAENRPRYMDRNCSFCPASRDCITLSTKQQLQPYHEHRPHTTRRHTLHALPYVFRVSNGYRTLSTAIPEAPPATKCTATKTRPKQDGEHTLSEQPSLGC